MNILSAEQMTEAEETLLKVAPQAGYSLVLPGEKDLQNMGQFQSSVFPVAGAGVQEAIRKMVTLTDNMRSLRLEDPNSVFHMLGHSLLSILYQDRCHSDGTEGQYVHYLLETVKCSLYSPDIDFACIKGVPTPVETIQMKAMAARFLVLMEEPSHPLAANRLRCAEWICERNPLLLLTFTLFFRFILIRLEIDGSTNYKDIGSVEECIVNLIEYFDLSYRNFGELFLFHEEGIFLALTEQDVVSGDYFENEQEKHTERQQEQIKQSVQLNMVESFLLNVDEKSSLIAPNSHKKKSAVVASDMKLLNFMLESSSEGLQLGLASKEKTESSETPHFNQESQDIFHFGKKKSQIMKHDMREEFKRLIMDQSGSEQEDNEHEESQAPTPFLGEAQNYSLAARFDAPHARMTLGVMDSPIDELGNVTINSVDCEEGQTPRKTGDHQVMFESAFTPQTGATGLNEGFPTTSLDNQFCRAQSEQTSFSDNPTIGELVKCPCRPFRANRNALSFKVVEVSYIPPPVAPNSILRSGSPKLFAQKYEHRKITSDFKSPADIKSRYTSNYVQNAPKNDAKPAFLKNLKKQREGIQVSNNQLSNSIVGEAKNRTTIDHTEGRTFEPARVLQKTSVIIPQRKPTHVEMGSKSTQKEVGSRSSKAIGQGNNRQRFNMAKPYQQEGPSQTQNWQTSSSFHPKKGEYAQPNPVNAAGHNSLFNQHSPRTGQPGQPYKFYAPVQIITPTVYMNNSKSSTNIVVKMSDFNDRSHNNDRSNNDRSSKFNPEAAVRLKGSPRQNDPLELTKPNPANKLGRHL